MSASTLRRVLLGYLMVLLPVSWLAMRFDPYIIDGDAVAYMDIADLLHAHRWAGAVNGYWHPLYPACLWLAQLLFHPTRSTELHAYYIVNWLIFLAQIAAMLAFTTALVRLRERMGATESALSLNTLRILGITLLVIAMARELSLGRVRPDALLQALILAGLAMLLRALASESLLFPPLMGLFFGLAYLTKSFAFVVALLSIAALVLFAWRIQRRPLLRTLIGATLAALTFAAVAGPYVAALSHQKHRFDFGDSGNLNYAWYVGHTEKTHLEPWMTSSFGAATVHLIHPEQQLLATPGIYSYRALPYGSYPPWFDTTFFNERIQPHAHLGDILHHDTRSVAQVIRYLFNHPEPLILFAILLALGAGGLGRTRFWWPVVALGLAMGALYFIVNVEERYVTVAYLAVLLPLFAALKVPAARTHVSNIATVLVTLLAFLALADSLRNSFENRRNQSVASLPHAWYNPQQYGAADALRALGVQPGDEIACVGTMACLNDNYWARLAGVRVLTEIYEPDPRHLVAHLDELPNRTEVYNTLRANGAKVLVGRFDPGEMNSTHPAAAGWQRLGETDFYALPLHLQ